MLVCSSVLAEGGPDVAAIRTAQELLRNALRGRVLRDRRIVSRVARRWSLDTVTKMAAELRGDATGRLGHLLRIEANNCVYGR